MKTNSRKKHKKDGSIFKNHLRGIPFKKISKQSGFCKRKPKKIDPKKLVIAFLLSIWESKRNTYNDWAAKLGLLINDTVSRQAVSKKIIKELLEYLRGVLTAIMNKSIAVNKNGVISERLKIFKRIIIEDSTTIHLDEKWSKEYPGSKNHLGKDFATMKIQAAYEVITRNFIKFEISNYRENDQSYAGKIMEIIKQGDLVIRDLGYFVTGVFKSMNQKGISFVSRLRQKVNIYSKNEEKPIDLAKMLRKRGNLDIEVIMGQSDRVPLRLIALPVEEKVASERRRKARAKKDHGHMVSKEKLFFLGWTLLITNIPKEQIDCQEIAKIYNIRWRIEIIFKCWKSFMRINNIPQNANRIRLEAFIYCMLIYILIFQAHCYIYYSIQYNKEAPERENNISLMKFIQYIVNNIALNVYKDYLSKASITNRQIKKQIGYYCSYENRLDRINYAQFLQKLS